jgi:hypothetical protein
MKTYELTNRYAVSESTARFDYNTADGDPPKSLKLDGFNWTRRGFHPLSYNAAIGLVWYERHVPAQCLVTNKG